MANYFCFLSVILLEDSMHTMFSFYYDPGALECLKFVIYHSKHPFTSLITLRVITDHHKRFVEALTKNPESFMSLVKSESFSIKTASPLK